MTIQRLRVFLMDSIKAEAHLNDIEYYRGRLVAFELILSLIGSGG